MFYNSQRGPVVTLHKQKHRSFLITLKILLHTHLYIDIHPVYSIFYSCKTIYKH